MQEDENQNYSEADALATEAYLDNYEYVEAPIAEKNQTLMETTEVMMREEIRQLIIEKAPTEEVKGHIENINKNLDRAEELLAWVFCLLDYLLLYDNRKDRQIHHFISITLD